MSGNRVEANCFDAFNDSPKKKDPTIQVLYEYEKHYLEMLKAYKDEIDFIQTKLQELRTEEEHFYKEILPEIKANLSHNAEIDEKVRETWLKKLEENINNSFEFSQKLINDYAIKNLDEFKKEVNEKIRNL